MELVLTRPEFFALMAMARAEGIVGLDPDLLLPSDSQQRQALYDEGEQSLAQRDLLRINAAQEVELELNLLRLVLTITKPTHALITVKTIPEVGRQLFLHYGVDGSYVEQTLPTETSHRLADVGDAAALCQRLEAIFPLVPPNIPAQSFETDGRALMSAYGTAVDGRVTEALAELDGLRDTDRQTAKRFLMAAESQEFSGSIAFIQIRLGEDNEASEIAIVSGAGENWLLIAGADSKIRAGAVSPADFDQVLRAVLIEAS